MATIKLQPSGKVVLKDGKVACECCGCLSYGNYPPSELFNKFQFEDLPSELTLAIPKKPGGDFFNESFLFTKPNSLEYVNPKGGSAPTLPVLFKTPTIIYPETGEQDYDFISLFQNNNFIIYATYRWYLDDLGDSGYQEGRFAYFNSEDTTKLFWEPIDSASYGNSGGFIFDSFSNAFLISGPTSEFIVSRGPRELSNIFPGGSPSEQMVLPTFFCNNLDLSGSPQEVPANITYYSGGGAALYFDFIFALDVSGNTLVSSTCKWKIKTPDGTFEKSGTQDTPVGSYGGGYTVS